jgi:NADH dehydrogenase
MANNSEKIRVVIVGGGFGGVYTALALERLRRHCPNMDVTLISRDNYFLITPLLFEAGSGVLEPRHAVCPIRPLLRWTRMIVAQVEEIDVDRHAVRAMHRPDNHSYQLEYDQLVLAVGGVTNRAIIPGSKHAMAFKTLSDAIALRNRIIDVLEQADVEENPTRKKQLLTMVVIGAGLVGVELVGEMTEFLRNICGTYRHVGCEDIKLFLGEAGPIFLREMSGDLASYARRTLEDRGVEIRVNTPVAEITPDGVTLRGGEHISAAVVILCAGVAPNPLLAGLPVAKNNGRIAVDAALRCKDRPEIWAVGDCAWIPGDQGKPYPQLAQHALREAQVLARNICHAVRGEPLNPFMYQTLGALAALGHYAGVGRVMEVQLRGFPAWWAWRSYYLLQMPGWRRRLRVMLDWTVALFFHNDVVKLVVDSGLAATARDLVVAPQAAKPRENTSSSALP